MDKINYYICTSAELLTNILQIIIEGIGMPFIHVVLIIDKMGWLQLLHRR